MVGKESQGDGFIHCFLLLTLGNGVEMIQFDWHRFFKWLGYGEGGCEIWVRRLSERYVLIFANYHVTPGNSLWPFFGMVK